jgi:hypothetical protein
MKGIMIKRTAESIVGGDHGFKPTFETETGTKSSKFGFKVVKVKPDMTASDVDSQR